METVKAENFKSAIKKYKATHLIMEGHNIKALVLFKSLHTVLIYNVVSNGNMYIILPGRYRRIGIDGMYSYITLSGKRYYLYEFLDV